MEQPGITYRISQGSPIGNLPHAFGAIGSLLVPSFAGVQMPLMGLGFVGRTVVAAEFLRYTAFGVTGPRIVFSDDGHGRHHHRSVLNRRSTTMRGEKHD